MPAPLVTLSNALVGRLFTLLSAVLGYRFSIAETDAERQAAYALRDHTFQDAGLTSRPSFPDAYDACAHTVLAWHRGEVVGTMRLIRAAERSFALGCYNIVLPPGVHPAQLIEISGLAISPRHRGGARLPIFGLLERSMRFSVDSGYRWWLGVASASKVRYYARFNPSCQVLTMAPPGETHLAHRARSDRDFRASRIRHPFLMDVHRCHYIGTLWTVLSGTRRRASASTEGRLERVRA